MWGPERDAGEVLQLATAALQHISGIVQHVLPAVRERSPQEAAALVFILQRNSEIAWTLCVYNLNIRKLPGAQSTPAPPQQQAQGVPVVGCWRQLLLSPHLLPCVAAAMVMLTSFLPRYAVTRSAQAQGSRGDQSSGSSNSGGQTGSGSRASKEPPNTTGQQLQSGLTIDNFSACQLQLLQLLGLAPEVIGWALEGFGLPTLYSQLQIAFDACADCRLASWESLHSSSTGAGVSVEQQQPWQFERHLWQLLPTVLLPCASSLLLPAAPCSTWAQRERAVQQLLCLSERSMLLADKLHTHLGTLGIPSAAAPAALCEEVLDVLLQLAGQLLHQQPLTATAAAAAATPVPIGGGSSSSITSTSSSTLQQATGSVCAEHILVLLLLVGQKSQASSPISSPNSIDHSNRLDGATVPVDVSPLSMRFVGYVSALEAALRAIAAAVHSSTIVTSKEWYAFSDSVCMLSCALLPDDGQTPSILMQHMGFWGPVVLAQEQQQLYSLLSTLQKLCCCARSAAQGDWQEQIAARCCVAAGLGAVGALTAAGAERSTEQQGPSPAATAAGSSLSYLPSLVLFGRCLLHWGGQLQKQAAELELLGSGGLQLDKTQALLYQCSSCVHPCPAGGFRHPIRAFKHPSRDRAVDGELGRCDFGLLGQI
jgi:hypothetical protein